jgi:hypothetical protein
MEVAGCYQHSWGIVTSKIFHFSPMASVIKNARSGNPSGPLLVKGIEADLLILKAERDGSIVEGS